MLKSVCDLLARVLIAAIFLLAAVGKITGFKGTEQYMASAGMPAAGFFLLGAIFLLVVGGLSVLLGFKAKWGAVLLIVFLLPATLIFHQVWKDPSQKIQFLKNLAILGGLIMVLLHGSGAWSLDKVVKLKKP